MSAATRDGRYVCLSRPRGAAVDVRFPGPMHFHVELTVRALNHGMPAAGSWSTVRTRLARAPLPTGTTTSALRRVRTHQDGELDGVRRLVTDGWCDLVARSPRLAASSLSSAPAYEDVSLLVVQRSGGRTVYVFVGDLLHPVLLLTPAASQGRVVEAAAQQRAAELHLAPRPLGRLGDWLVQEGVPGMPLWLDSTPDGLSWTGDSMLLVEQVHDKLGMLARGTARAGRPSRVPVVFAQAASVPMSPATRRALRAVEHDLRRLDVTVLEHCDVSAQNVLVSDGLVTALVDWEFAAPDGVLGIDHVNGALSLAEHARGRWDWSDDASYRLLHDGWDDAAIFTRARDRLRLTLEEVTGSAALAPQVEAFAMLSRATRRHRAEPGPRVGWSSLLRSLDLVLSR